MKVPDWLAHPEVCPVSMKVPEPDAMLVVKLPCIVMVLVAVPPGGVQAIVIATALLFIAAGLRLPLNVVPTPKHGDRLPSPLKFRVFADSMVLVWVKLKLNPPGCGWAAVDSAADHEPLAEVELGLPPQAVRKTARASTAGCNRYRITGTLANLDEATGCWDVPVPLSRRREPRRSSCGRGMARPSGRFAAVRQMPWP